LRSSWGLESDLSAVFRVGAVQEPLIEYVRLFAGPTALDCGQHRFPIAQNELKQSVACGLAASGRREAFLAVVDNGQTQTGLLGTVEGVVYRFNYNTSFSIRRCPAPTATGREFTCLFPANETTPFSGRKSTSSKPSALERSIGHGGWFGGVKA
jgi:hypothetical protein